METHLLVVVESLTLGLASKLFVCSTPVDLPLVLLERTDPLPQPTDKLDLALQLVLQTDSVRFGVSLLSRVSGHEKGEMVVCLLEGGAGSLLFGDAQGSLQ